MHSVKVRRLVTKTDLLKHFHLLKKTLTHFYFHLNLEIVKLKD